MGSKPNYTVTTVLSSPFVMNKRGGGYEGYIVDMLEVIADRLGFDYGLRLSRDGRYGGIAADGSWSGMIGEVQRQEADIAAADLTITAERTRVVDFSTPFLTQSLRLLVRKPPRSEMSLGYLLQPFSNEVWLCILFALIIVAILLMVIGRFDPYEWRQVPSDKDPRGARHSFGLRESLMFVFSTATLQGYRETPRSLAGRVLTVSWFIFIFLIAVSYIANVVAFAVAGVGNKMPPIPFNDIDDLLDQRDIRIGMTGNGSTYNTFKRRSNLEKARFESPPFSFVKTTEEGIQKVARYSGNFVMLLESLKGEYIASRLPCNLMMHGSSRYSSGLGLAARKGSDLGVRINLAILKLIEDGTLDKLHRKWWLYKGECPASDTVSLPKSLRISTAIGYLRALAAPFLILLLGVIFSVIVLVGEVVYKKIRQ